MRISRQNRRLHRKGEIDPVQYRLQVGMAQISVTLQKALCCALMRSVINKDGGVSLTWLRRVLCSLTAL
jgi:hypothetical protein